RDIFLAADVGEGEADLMRSCDLLILVMADIGQEMDAPLVAADIGAHRAGSQVTTVKGHHHADLDLLHEVPGMIDIVRHGLCSRNCSFRGNDAPLGMVPQSAAAATPCGGRYIRI